MTEKKLLIIICNLIFFGSFCSAQNGHSDSGARGEAMANTTAATSDVWAVFNNMAALSGSEEFMAGFACKSQYGIFRSAAVCAAAPAGDINIGAGVYRFGDEVYSESRAALGIGHQIGFVGVGLTADYLAVRIAEYGSHHALALSLGGVIHFSSAFRMGLHIHNFNQAKLSDSHRRPPVSMKLGFSFSPDETVTLNAEIHRRDYFKPGVKVGAEYAIIRQLLVRTGFATSPSKGYFGAGFRTTRLDIDVSLSSHPTLGTTQQLSLNYKPTKK